MPNTDAKLKSDILHNYFQLAGAFPSVTMIDAFESCDANIVPHIHWEIDKLPKTAMLIIVAKDVEQISFAVQRRCAYKLAS